MPVPAAAKRQVLVKDPGHKGKVPFIVDKLTTHSFFSGCNG